MILTDLYEDMAFKFLQCTDFSSLPVNYDCKTHGFSCVHINIRSIRKYWDKFRILVNSVNIHFAAYILRLIFQQRLEISSVSQVIVIFPILVRVVEVAASRFGLSNAPAMFKRMMDSVLRGLRWQMSICYLDGVVVYSASFSDYVSLTGLFFMFSEIWSSTEWQEVPLCL